MKYGLITLVVFSFACLVGCAPKEEANTVSPPTGATNTQQAPNANPANNQNIPPQVQQMKAEQQKQHRDL